MKTIAKVFMLTHGCQMNEYDSNRTLDMLRQSYQVIAVNSPEEADIALLNTCSIREKASERMFSKLGEWNLLKKQRPDLIIAVGGCVASQEGRAIVRRAPYVDLVYGPQTLHRVPEMLKELKNQSKRRAIVDTSFPEIEKFDRLPAPKAQGPHAFVSIMEGCSKYCSFCVVPYTRGEEISRPFDDIIAEVDSLVRQGAREISLLGQNVNDYRGLHHNQQPSSLAELIHTLAAFDEIVRIRFSTSHPLAFSEDLIAAYAEEPKLANHLHLPVQSGSNRILGMMKRGYTVEMYRKKIAALRAVRSDISITSDFIVGFPTESADDFAKTMDLVTETNFDQSFSFIYSPRPGTPAALLVDSISMEEKKQRLQSLQTQLNAQAQNYSRTMIGSTQTILVERPARKNSQSMLAGRTENNRVVNFEGPSSLIGQLVEVEITEALSNCLRGVLKQRASA